MINAIEDKTEKFQIVWDLGRRCTYECSYCPPHRNNKWSPLVEFDELKRTMDSLNEYCEIYDKFRKEPLMKALSFTGGEPTAHPAFFKFMAYIKEEYPEFKRGLTTNGAFSKKKLELCKQYITGGTISYHPEGTPKQNKLVLHNIIELKDTFKVNVMFHKDYFNECIELCSILKKNNVTFVPRVIGDSSDDDEKLVEMGYAHEYNEEQMAWFRNYWKKPPAPKNVSNETHKDLGRPCCGSRSFSVMENGVKSTTKFLSDTDFEGWHCMVNWFFLYINQELDLVWSHQTCGVNLDNEVKPLCKLSELNKYTEELSEMMFENKMPMIKCPKSFCGCGMCITKAKDDITGIELFQGHVNILKPKITLASIPLDQQDYHTTYRAFKYHDKK
jgi:MoaA/NifB/PqqE/SkfB family radical SAM enzyme